MPELWKAAGKHARTRIASDDAEFEMALKKKIVEEAQEAVEAETKDKVIGELATILECINTYLKIHGVPFEELEKRRKDKNDRMGTFEKKTISEE